MDGTIPSGGGGKPGEAGNPGPGSAPPPAAPEPASPSRRERLGCAAGKRLWVLTALALAASAAAILAPIHWAFENAGEFRLQLLAGQSLLAAAWAALPALRLLPWRKAAAPLALLAAASALHALAIAPLWTAPPARGAAGSLPFRVLSANVHTANSDFASVLAAVERERPDVVVLLEVDSRWSKALAPLDAAYPFRAFSPSDGDNFGIAILSRVPGSRARIDNPAPAEPRVADTAHALFEWEGKTVEVIGVHAVPPVSASYARGNLAELKALAA
ncbi:MAG: hypothetical protein MUC63_01500, partial [Planctomycetes bacterium]|nr:hypothetical protein [Planctomycetota bacterium]